MTQPRRSLAVFTLLILTVWCAPAERAGVNGSASDAIPGVSGPALPLTAPGDVGLSEKGVARIAAAMQAFVDDGRLPGVMTLISRKGKMLPDGLTSTSAAYGFGLGFSALIDEDATADADHNGVFRWGGYANTFFWIDPEAELIAMVWTQLTPFGAHDLSARFQTLVYEALGDS